MQAAERSPPYTAPLSLLYFFMTASISQLSQVLCLAHPDRCYFIYLRYSSSSSPECLEVELHFFHMPILLNQFIAPPLPFDGLCTGLPISVLSR